MVTMHPRLMSFKRIGRGRDGLVKVTKHRPIERSSTTCKGRVLRCAVGALVSNVRGRCGVLGRD